jgi:transcription antitermination factor NusG
MNIHVGDRSDHDFWCAIQVAPRREISVSKILGNKGYQLFTPTYPVKRHWSDRVRYLDHPLFPGYIFCRLANDVAGPIYSTPGVVRILGCGGSISFIEDSQIDDLQRAVASGRPIKPAPLAPGVRVRITRGPLAGVSGTLRSLGTGYELVLSVDLLRRGASVVVGPGDITPENVGSLAIRESLDQPVAPHS